MLDALKQEQNYTLTENGAKTFRSTESDCLNLFAAVGALRDEDGERLSDLFIKAFAENPDYALRIAFYARDIRGGLGERSVFRNIMRTLAFFHFESAVKNIPFFAEYGRYDDLLVLLGTPCENELVKYIAGQLEQDESNMTGGNPVSLLAKWLPSVNTSNADAKAQGKRLCRLLGMSEKNYRQRLSALRSYIDIIENRLRVGDYTFDYEKQTSKSLYKYRKVFWKNDSERYSDFIKKVKNGHAELKTNSLYPYDIVRDAMREGLTQEETALLDVTWKSLKDYTDRRNALVVVDGSGSMYGGGNPIPIEVAISLGIYFAERNNGYFKNHFITFSRTPRLVEIKGQTIYDKVNYCMRYNEVANTDLFEVFMLVLITAVKNGLPQSELPETIYIISDMEFDKGVNPDRTVFEDAKEKFEEYGYNLPNIVYWNVQSRNEQYPVTMNEQGAALVSGASPSVFKMAMSQNVSPYAFMLSVLNSERYSKIMS